MSSRNRIHSHHSHHHLLRHSPPPPPPPSSSSHHRLLALEDRLASQHLEIQSLLLDNQRLAATHVALQQELNSSQHHLRLAARNAVQTKDDRDLHLRHLLDRSAKLESESLGVDSIRAELDQVRLDVGKLGKAKEEMVHRLDALKGELATANGEIGQAGDVKAEVEFMRKEIQRGRAAVEYEKKAHADNLEQGKAMEKNMISLAREVEKLRAELANAEKRARAAAAAAAAAKPGQGYAETYGNSEMAYGGSTYVDAYSLHQSQRGADGGSQYGSAAVSHGLHDIQQTHAHR